MKLKKILLSALLGTGLSSLAMANTLEKVYIAGAPAFRQASNTTINAIVTGYVGGGVTATSANAVTFPTLASASQVQWLIPNFVPGSVDLEINASWTGSSSGIQSVASGTITQKFITDGTGSVATPSLSVASGTFTSYQPHISLSNTYQEATPYNGTVTFPINSSGGTFTATFATLYKSAPLGVEPYRWVASPGFPVSNITSEQLQKLFKNGRLPLAFFTGNSADQGTFVYGLSRDNGSGARIAAQIQPGIGALTKIKGYKANVTGGSLDSAGNNVGGTFSGTPALYPKGSIASLNNIYFSNDGDTGYPSFGKADLTGLLQAVTATGSLYTITYLNNLDASEAIAAGAVDLAYNGTLYTLGNLQEGRYPFWAYQFLYRDNGLGGNQLAFANLIESNFNTYADIQVSSLNVSRTSDGGPLSKNY